jgi:hypothetical protein
MEEGRRKMEATAMRKKQSLGKEGFLINETDCSIKRRCRV